MSTFESPKDATHRGYVKSMFTDERYQTWLQEQGDVWVGWNGYRWPKGTESHRCTQCGCTYEGNPKSFKTGELLLDTIRPVTRKEIQKLYEQDVQRSLRAVQYAEASIEQAQAQDTLAEREKALADFLANGGS